MKANQYQVIKHYLLTSEYLKWMKTAEKKAKWQHKAKKFVILKGQLFYEEKKDQATLVVQKY